MKTDWKDKKESFEVMDVRKATGNFLTGILKKAGQVEVGHGICVVQTFEPIPLYSAMADLGFEHHTDKISNSECRVYFHRTKIKDAAFSGAGDMPLKPTAVLNFKKIDDSLADIVVNFWDLTWGKENPAINLKTKLLLSLANGVLSNNQVGIAVAGKVFPDYEITPDSQNFIILQGGEGQSRQNHVILVTRWFDALRETFKGS